MRSVAETRAGPLAVSKEAKNTSNILSHAREVCTSSTLCTVPLDLNLTLACSKLTCV